MPSTPAFERLAVMQFKAEEIDTGNRLAWLVASTPTLDRSGERVDQEALAESADRYMRNPVVTWQHDTNEPIGHVKEIDTKPERTAIRVFFSGASARSQAAFGFVSDGTLRAASIGFNPYSRSFGPHPDGTPDYVVSSKEAPAGMGPQSGSLDWKRIDWMETGLVTIPCNQEAVRQFAKGLGLALPDLGTPEPPAEPDPELPADTLTAEDLRCLDDCKRLTGSVEAIRNILTCWHKRGRVLAPDLVAAILDAQAVLAGALQPHVETAQDAGALSGAGLSLPSGRKPGALSLPLRSRQPRHLALP